MKEVWVLGNPSYEKQGLKRLHSLAKSIPKIDYKESVCKGSSCITGNLVSTTELKM